MLGEIALKQRDRYSVEAKFRYDADAARRSNSYSVRFYFFFPQPFEISRSSYDPRSLMDQLKVHLRFNTPDIELSELLEPLSDVSPLVRAEKMVRVAEGDPGQLRKSSLIHETKLLGCIYKSTLRDFYLGIREKHASPGTEPNPPSGLADELKALHEVARRFHGIRHRLSNLDLPPELIQHISMVDEHLSLLLSKYLTQLLRLWDSFEADDEYKRAAKILQKEERYRLKAEYPSVPSQIRTERQFEEYVYREKMLKRYVTEELQFDVSRTNTGKRTEHILYAVAAGIAMIVATGVAFFGQRHYGNLTSALFVLLVLGYMVKDRIKDLFRDVLMRRIGGVFPVRKTVIRDANHRRRLAVLSERLAFRDERHLPEPIRRRRSRGYFEKVLFSSEEESTLLYSKRIRLRSRALEALHSRINSVADITTIDLRPFLRKLSAQYGMVPVVQGKRHVNPRIVKRIYHMNLLVEYASSSGATLERYRIIVDARGIKRVEHVSPAGATGALLPRVQLTPFPAAQAG